MSKSEFGKMQADEEEESSALRDQIMHVEIIMYCKKKKVGGRGTKRIFHFHLDTRVRVQCAEHTELRSE